MRRLGLLFFAIVVTAPSLYAEKYAFLFASNYKGSPVSDLELAEKDALLMRRQIVKTRNFKSKNVRVLVGPQMTRANVKKVLLGWLAKKVREGDQVFVYYAGHGTFVRDSKAKNGMRNSLVMHTRPHITDDELNDWFNKIKTKKAIIIFDCCYSGGIAKKGAKVRGNANIPIPKGADSLVVQDIDGVYFKDKIVISSSDDNETAIEIGPPIRQGVFTHYFAKAILKADLNNDKKVTAYEAFYKARNETIQLAKKARHRQHPQISGNASGFLFVDKAKKVGKPKKISKPKKPDNPILTVDGNVPIDEKDPPVDPTTEPTNANNKKKGNLVLNTTFRRSVMKKLTFDATVKDHKRIGVYIDGKRVNKAKVYWRKHSTWGRVAQIKIQRLKTGVHNVVIKANNYLPKLVKTGIEAGKTTYETVLVAQEGRGSIEGHAWVGNFSKPFPKMMIFLKPIRVPRQPTVRTRKDGSFVFRDLLPGEYEVFTVAGMKYFTKPYSRKVTVEENKVSKLEVILKEIKF